MQAIFTLTLFVSATLLFVVQPMFAKMVLPRLGGTPAVWNTCMVFYQAVLLGGYVYAHLSTRWLGPRRQAFWHLGVLCLPWLVLPVAVGSRWIPPGDANPIPWLLGLMALSIGLPFLVVSASGPMLQAWFAASGHRAAKDPYFLFAASNLGSMLALLGYPAVVEPYLPLAQQSQLWAVGYGLLMALTIGCAWLLWRSQGLEAGAIPEPTPARGHDAALRIAEAEPVWWQRLRWLALSFAPSSLLLGVTTFIATDIASAPLLWVIPLALYLLTFVLVFARWTVLPHRLMVCLQPLLVVALAACYLQRLYEWMAWLVVLHLAAFFVTAMVCHGELARSRPKAHRLTEFYLWLSVGGMLGGIFNAIVAPMVFTSVIEYPLMVVLACLLRPAKGAAKSRSLAYALDLLLPLAMLGLLRGLMAVEGHWLSRLNAGLTAANGIMGHGQVELTLETAILGLGALAVLGLQFRPLRLACGVAGLLLVGGQWFPSQSQVIYAERTFFGVVRVKATSFVFENAPGRLREPRSIPIHMLIHGSTNHGEQWCDVAMRRTPVTYYTRSGPFGQVMMQLVDPVLTREIGVIGLGTGTTAAYGMPGQTITYFEIDPVIAAIARDSRYFSYLHDSAAETAVVLGDARLSLARQSDGRFDVLVVDAFSSDALPIHLFTREAFALYLGKLADNGILVINITNRHLELGPVLAELANDAKVVARHRIDNTVSRAEEATGKQPSHWVVMARKPERLGSLLNDPEWRPLESDPAVKLWTDDFSNILSVLKLRRSR